MGGGFWIARNVLPFGAYRRVEQLNSSVFKPEDGGNIFFRIAGKQSKDYTAQLLKRQPFIIFCRLNIRALQVTVKSTVASLHAMVLKVQLPLILDLGRNFQTDY
jgi:hypothetical protein